MSAKLGGGQTYLKNLLGGIPPLDNLRILVLAPRSLALPETPSLERMETPGWNLENPFIRMIWERFFLPGLLRKIRADILFCPGGIIGTRPPRGCRTVSMFRNMMPFDRVLRSLYPLGYKRFRNWVLEKVLLKSMIRADLLIFISRYAKEVIQRLAPNGLRNAVVISHGVSDQFRVRSSEDRARPVWLPRNEYFLYVSHIDVYKSQLEVVRAYGLLKRRRRTEEKLVLAGPSINRNYAKQVVDEVMRLGLQQDVMLLGEIPHGQLPLAYHHAKINLFASRCENCPNILLEALAAGRPLLVSNRQPMPEFGEDAVVYFDPENPEELAEKMASIVDDENVLCELSRRAQLQSEKFDWARTSELTWQTVIELAKIPK
jgi:glycosyltransferase involved in cell wall biosynthesis